MLLCLFGYYKKSSFYFSLIKVKTFNQIAIWPNLRMHLDGKVECQDCHLMLESMAFYYKI